jgi:hypothetical protein
MSSNSITITVNKDNDFSKTITVYCRISYTKTTQSWIPATETSTGYWGTGTDSLETSNAQSSTVTIYYHPGKFSMGAKSGIDYPNSSDSIIANILDSDIINNEWIPHFQKAYHWYH